MVISLGDELARSVNPNSDKLSYLKQIDALRAIAVFLVLIEHFVSSKIIHEVLPWGMIGVWLFFVLSGFLITRILLSLAEEHEHEKDSARKRLFSIRQFYLRRALRIWPVYYLLLVIVALAGLPTVREGVIWHITYLSNFYFEWYGWASPVSHFWSLALEEQFYIIWAPLILLFPRRFRTSVIWSLIVLAFLSRLNLRLNPNSSIRVWLTFFYPIDALCIGSLLTHNKIYATHWWKYVSRANLFLLLILLSARYGDYAETLVFVALPLSLSLACASLVLAAATGISGIVGKALGCWSIRYVGKISYGIYLYHYVVPPLLFKCFPRMLKDLPPIPGVMFLLYVAITFAIAVASWHLFEWPINQIKAKVNYRPSTKLSPVR